MTPQYAQRRLAADRVRRRQALRRPTVPGEDSDPAACERQPSAPAAGPDAGAATIPAVARVAVPPPDPELARRIAAASASPDPYVRWLLGLETGADPWPPAPLPAVLKAATIAPASSARTAPTWVREASALTVRWRLAATPTSATCAPLTEAVRRELVAAGYTGSAPHAVDPEADTVSTVGVSSPLPALDQTIDFTLTQDEVERRLGFSCLDASRGPAPGCTGACKARTIVTLAFTLALPAPPFNDVDSALRPFPPLLEGVKARVVPPFLAERAATLPMVRLSCEGFAHGGCDGDFAMALTSPADPRSWILDSIRLATPHGFSCDETYKDPSDWIASTQACSGRNLYYHTYRDELQVRLGVIVGLDPEADPVTCSARPAPADPGPADPDVSSILDVPVSGRTVEHLDHVEACYARHQLAAGRQARLGGWKRLGDYLERTSAGDSGGAGATFGTVHHRDDPAPADGFYLRSSVPVAAGRTVEIYAVQDSFEESFGRVVLTVKDQGVTAVTVQTDPTSLATPDAFKAVVQQAIDDAASRDRRAAGQVMDCDVLPNGGQKCLRRAATPDEQSRATAAADERAQRLTADQAANGAALYAAVAGVYPFGDPSCALLFTGSPR